MIFVVAIGLVMIIGVVACEVREFSSKSRKTALTGEKVQEVEDE